MFDGKTEDKFDFDTLLVDLQLLIYSYLSYADLSSMAFFSKKQYEILNAHSFWHHKLKNELQIELKEGLHPALHYISYKDRKLIQTYFTHEFLISYLRDIHEDGLQKASAFVHYIALYTENNSLPLLLESVTKLQITIPEILQKKFPERLDSFNVQLLQHQQKYNTLLDGFINDPNYLDCPEAGVTPEVFILELLIMGAKHSLDLAFKGYKKPIDYSRLFQLSNYFLRLDSTQQLLKFGVDVNQLTIVEELKIYICTPLFHVFYSLYTTLKSVCDDNPSPNLSLVDSFCKENFIQKLEDYTQCLLGSDLMQLMV